MKITNYLRTITFLSLCLFFVGKTNAQLSIEVNGISNPGTNSFCTFEDIVFTAVEMTLPPAGDYIWDMGDGTTLTGQSTVAYTYTSPGVYNVTVTNAATQEQAEISVFVIQCFVSPTIFGESQACEGDCLLYFADQGYSSYEWQVIDPTGAFIFASTQVELEFCFTIPGAYQIQLVVTDQNGATGEEILTVQVLGQGMPFNIVSLANTFCASDSLNPSSCEKICANSTAIYTIPNGQNVEWEVQGAESFVANGNSVEVQWGAPGNGLVSAVAQSGGTSDLIVNCFKSNDLYPSNNSSLLYAEIFGGTPPYTYDWSGFGNPIGNGTEINVTTPGDYQITVTDANGISASCHIAVTSNPNGTCFFNYTSNLTTITHESNCGSCDGAISQPGSSNNTYLWSNGTTSNSQSGLCSGFYSVTITDGTTGCELIRDFTIGCEQSSNGCPTESTLCIDILEDPDAAVATIPAAANGVISICEGQTVLFNNESEGATLFEWDFGNGNISSNIHTEQTYPDAGTYQVYMIARNDCYCSDTTFLTVDVTDAETPMIDCVGSICEGETVTYTSSSSCSNFNWTITGNYNLIDGGGVNDDFVTVEWLTGPEGIIELSVNGCTSGNVCLAPTIEVIPIISDDAEIEGPEKVCQEDEAIYFIDDYAGTDFVWTVSTGGVLLEGQNTNRIKVKWDGPVSPNAQQNVSVDYTNCYLGCGGSDQLDVYILPQLYIDGDIEACENGMSTHNALKNSVGSNTVDCDWTVTYGNGTVAWTSAGSTSSINLDWNNISFGEGRYAIRAIPSNPLEVCDAFFVTYVNVLLPPPTVGSINGITEVCPGQTYTYEAISTENDVQFSWSINDGGNISTKEGKTINVIFGNSPPYILSVSQISTAGLACESEPIDLEVFPLPSFTVSGDGNVCEETSGNYMTNSFPGVSYEWNIVPADAGTIISGENTNAIEVFWHQDGPATVEATICGTTESTPVTILPRPEPIINAPPFVCKGGTATVSVSNAFLSYLWKDEAGGTISASPTVIVNAGFYELEVIDAFGCQNNVAFTIEEYPNPEVLVSVPGSRVICFANGDPAVEIHATEVPNGYTYQWFHNGTAIPSSNSSVITTMQYGTYDVEVTDINGCVTLSKPITLHEYCGSGTTGVCNNPGLPASCDQGTSVQFTFSSAGSCDIFDFTNTSPDFQPGTILWDFDDLNSGVNNESTLENPSHIFSNVGYYIVTLTALNSAGILCWDADTVSVPIVSNFDFGTACVGSPVQFEDLTAFLPDETVASWSWEFGDPGSGVNNTSTDQHPSHTYSAPGSYNVILTTTHTSGCTASKAKTVVIEPLPTMTFDDPVFNCQATALSFEAMSPNNIVSYSWIFDDPASGIANTSEIANPWHSFDAPGNYTVVCTGTDIYGCTVLVTNVITVEPNTLNGIIDFSIPSPLCEGDVTTLTAPVGGTSWVWSDPAGSTSNSITTGEAGVYTVTITDEKGCEYITPPATIDIIPLPTATIQAVEYNEFGQPVGSFYDGYATCEGEDVILQVVDNANYAYTWSNGTIGNELIFSEERNNLLSAGTHNFTLDIVDLISGCTNTVGPFTVVIHPTPSNITITNSPVTSCENTLTTFSVDNPDANLTYIWNTGEVGTTISTSVAGEYFVKAITTFGCTGESNKLDILRGPDINKIPNGCHTRCTPDTICLPTMNNISSYQWYFNNTAIPAPNGNIGDLIATQSGAYYVEMIDVNGCTATSDVLTLDLLDGFGSFMGNVYMDVNDNGIIDAGDTLVNGIDIILLNGGVAQDTVTSGANGGYDFLNILSTNYTLQLDLTGLPIGITAVYNNIDTALVGCDDMETVDWLLQESCITSTSTLDTTTCFGVDVVMLGNPIPVGVPTDLIYTDVNGCDSIVTVTVTEFPTLTSTLDTTTCFGIDVVILGNPIPVGVPTDLTYTDVNGCDSIVTVTVTELPVPTSTLDTTTCFGIDVVILGNPIPVGVPTDLMYTDVNGCDSVVTVTVTELPNQDTTTELNSCDGNDVIYNGTTLAVGSITNFAMTSPEGCAYTETVEVVPFPTSFTPLEFIVCPDDTYEYNNQELAIGSLTEFIFTDVNGCDSTVVVSIMSSPLIQYDAVATDACWNGTDGNIEISNLFGTAPIEFSIDGTNFQTITSFENLAPNDYTLYAQDGNGCNSELDISVNALEQIEVEFVTPSLPCDGSEILVQTEFISGDPNTALFEWPDGTTQPLFLTNEANTYSVEISNVCETITEQVTVGYESEEREEYFYIPNAFSPNQDGANDIFVPVPAVDITVESLDFYVFDRWGNHLFDTHVVDSGWNGRLNGQMYKPGVYVWYIRANITSCGRTFEYYKQGDVTITQ